MAISKTFSILFWMNSSRAKNNEAELYVRISVNGKRVNLSLKRKANLELWDAKIKRLKGKNAVAKQTNQYLEEVHSQIYQDLKYKGELITAELIKAHYTRAMEERYGERVRSRMRELFNLVAFNASSKDKRS